MNLPPSIPRLFRRSRKAELYTLTPTRDGTVVVWQRGYGEWTYSRRGLLITLAGTLSDEHGDQPPPHPSRRYVLSEALKMLD